MGSSPCGHKESGMTEATEHSLWLFFFSHFMTFGGIHHLKITPVNNGPGVSFSQVLNSS